MNDLKDVLAAALGDSDGHGPGRPAGPGPADPQADLARGRRLLRRRRLAGLAGAAGGAAAAAGIATVVLTAGPAGPRPAPVTAPSGQHASRPAGPVVTLRPRQGSAELVSYRGYQAPGYRVSEVPRGWVVQGSNAFALTVAPRDDPDKFVSSFVGKIAVMLLSRDEPVPSGQPNVMVAGHPGFLRQGDGTGVLKYQAASGQWVLIQFPARLGWHRAQFIRFAEGVTVLPSAQQGRG
jgi:hypothetical protein